MREAVSTAPSAEWMGPYNFSGAARLPAGEWVSKLLGSPKQGSQWEKEKSRKQRKCQRTKAFFCSLPLAPTAACNAGFERRAELQVILAVLTSLFIGSLPASIPDRGLSSNRNLLTSPAPSTERLSLQRCQPWETSYGLSSKYMDSKMSLL